MMMMMMTNEKDVNIIENNTCSSLTIHTNNTIQRGLSSSRVLQPWAVPGLLKGTSPKVSIRYSSLPNADPRRFCILLNSISPLQFWSSHFPFATWVIQEETFYRVLEVHPDNMTFPSKPSYLYLFDYGHVVKQVM